MLKALAMAFHTMSPASAQNDVIIGDMTSG